jgi:hypothetical protein
MRLACRDIGSSLSSGVRCTLYNDERWIGAALADLLAGGGAGTARHGAAFVSPVAEMWDEMQGKRRCCWVTRSWNTLPMRRVPIRRSMRISWCRRKASQRRCRREQSPIGVTPDGTRGNMYDLIIVEAWAYSLLEMALSRQSWWPQPAPIVLPVSVND